MGQERPSPLLELTPPPDQQSARKQGPQTYMEINLANNLNKLGNESIPKDSGESPC